MTTLLGLSALLASSAAHHRHLQCQASITAARGRFRDVALRGSESQQGTVQCSTGRRGLSLPVRRSVSAAPLVVCKGHRSSQDSSSRDDSSTSTKFVWQQTLQSLQESTRGRLVALAFGLAVLAGPAIAADPGKVGLCLFGSCQRQLASCLTDGECLEDLVCLNLCNNKKDETACQIRCGDLYSDKAVATFNSCAVSDKKCVPQRVDENVYPVPKDEVLVKSFPLNEFEGRWYITAGQNPLFDTFDCQVHYFGNPEPGKLVAKLNWRIPKSKDDFIDRDAVQYFKQQAQPALLLNHDNDFLHYQDDWYIVAYKPNEYAFVYYKGNNDAWKGYGGAVIYTREAKLPEQYIPALREAAAKVNMDWDKDITITDNTCGPHPIRPEGLIARVEKFASDEARALEYTIESDLRSFGKGATVIEKDFETEFTRDEKFIGKELRGAIDYIEGIESRYKEPTWLQRLSQTLHLPFASQSIPKP